MFGRLVPVAAIFAAQLVFAQPTAGGISPAGVGPGAGSGLAQTFTFSFLDPAGYADLSVLDILINNYLDGAAACYIAFVPASASTGYLYLVDDGGDGSYVSGTPAWLPSSGVWENSQCKISGTGSSVSASGNTLTLTLAITFTPAFAGNKIFYTAARSATENSGWQALGTWNVPGLVTLGPAVGGVTPGESVTAGQTFTFTFTDTNGYADLAVVDILTNGFLDAINACYVAYVPTSASAGYLYLVDDAGDGAYAPGSPMLLSSGGALKNSQCSINTAASSASASGGTLTLNLAITFFPGFAGNQVFYLASRNNGTGTSGWQAAGSVSVPAFQNLTLSETSIAGGTSVTATVILASPASSSGTTVTLSSSNPSVQVPASVTVASGMTSAHFTVATGSVIATQTAAITASLGISSAAAVLTVFPGGPATLNPADTIVITDKSGINQINYPEQIGRPFVDGEISNYPMAILNGSTPLFTQADVKNRYPDGSVKFAILSFLLPSLPANGSVTIAFGNQATGNNTPLTLAQMLDPSFNFDAQMILTGNSATQSASARTMLTNGSFTYWTSGPVATTVILADHSAAAAYDMGFDAHRSIRPIFEATFWPSISKVKVRYVLEDSNTLALEDVSYSATLTIGDTPPSAVYNSATTWPAGIPQVGATRWTKTFWIGGTPTGLQNLNYNLAYLESTSAVPNFDTTKVISAVAMTLDYAQWEAGTTDIYQAIEGSNAYTWDAYMADTGGRFDIAPFPAWYTRWLYTGDYREREIMLGNADRASAWPVNIREGATGKFFDLAASVPAIGHVLSIAARPTVDFSQAWTQPNANGADRIKPVGPIMNFNTGTWQWDSAHLPDAFFLPYLATGDYFYLEQMNFWTAFSAAYPVASTTENYGRGSSLKSGVVYMGQVRSEAWGLRERAESAWIEPDGTPEQTLFNQWMASYIGVLDGLYDQTSSQYFGNADWNWGHTVRIANPNETYDGIHHPPIPGHSGVEWNYGANSLCGGNYGTNATVNSCQSGFMLSYLTYTLGRAYQLGFPTNNLLGNVVGPWYVAVVTDPTYNPYMLLADRIPTQKVAGPAYYSSMPDILTGYWQTLAQAAAAGANVWRGLSSFPLNDPVNGYEFLGTAAIAAIKNFTPGGTEAWNWVYAQVESASTYGNTPDWALLPVEP
ncbi:MAG TPA: hypothetical protein VGG72_17580 [Bryobacteraceae bacterium]